MNYISSIQNTSDGKFLVWKSPIEDFNDGSILTVNPGERAIFVNNGEIVTTFINGRYELTTQNYPFINAFRRFLANGQSTFRCSIYFVSEAQSTEVLWGFQLPVRDPVQNIYTKIFVRGSYVVRVNDGGKLLTQLLGMNLRFMGTDDLKSFFGNKFQQHISNTLGKYISSSEREVLDLCNDTIAITEEIRPSLDEMVVPGGLEISGFAISAMQVDSNDPNRRLLEMAYAKKREMEIMGTNYGTIKETDIRTNASSTPFAGYGNPSMMLGVNPSGQIHPQSFVNVTATPQHPQSQLSAQQQTHHQTKDWVEKLKQLAEMKERGIISEEEFVSLKSKLLKNID